MDSMEKIHKHLMLYSVISIYRVVLLIGHWRTFLGVTALNFVTSNRVVTFNGIRRHMP